MMEKRIYITACVPEDGAEIYDGIRIAISDSEREAMEDLAENFLTEDFHGMKDEELQEALTLCLEIRTWKVEERLLTCSPELKATEERAPLAIIKELCEAFVRREREHGGYGKGVKRDNAAIEFFVGAANAVKLTTGKDSDDSKELQTWIALILCTRGYAAIAEELKP